MKKLFRMIKDKFGRRNSEAISIDDLRQGQLVKIEFYNPQEIGIQAPNGQLSCTRFNPNEFEDRMVKGFVSKVGKFDGGSNFGKYVTVDIQGHGEFRQFLLLKHEIKSIKVLE